MRKAIMTLMILAIAGTAFGTDLSTSARGPEKPETTYHYDPPQVILQGGDTILDAVLIVLPFSHTGTTAGYNDDYDEVCPYGGSTSPDVVYTFTADSDGAFNVDLAGSSYDTKVYVYDENLSLVACNDDFYLDYTSKIEGAPMMAGVQYFIVVDGYGGDSGDYLIEVTANEPCSVSCHPEAVLEDEPALVDDYVDLHNGGCNTDPNAPPFQTIDWANNEAGEAWLCGVSGWFLSEGANFRDTDWFTATIGESGVVTLTVESEHEVYLFELGPQDCNSVGVVQQVIADCGAPATLNIVGTPGDPVWLWIGPTVFDGPVNEFPYFATLSGHLWVPPVPTEDFSWGGVKALYR